MQKKPPRHALNMLRWYCREDFLDEIEGNLIELFNRQANQNYNMACWWFVLQVLLHFRPDFVKAPSFIRNLSNSHIMLRNYLKIAIRNLRRTPSFTIIHIAGLTIGITASLLIFQYIHFEKNFDTFHELADRIYRVPITYSEGFGSFPKTASNHPGLGPAMLQDFPEVESFVRMVHPSNFGGTLTLRAQNESGQLISFTEEAGYLADSTFFDIFTFPLLEGNPQTALDDPSGIVITKNIAEKYFGTPYAVGKEIQTNFAGDKKLSVSAVVNDLPPNSHIDFEILIPFHSFFAQMSRENLWVWPEFHTYVLLKPGATPTNIEAEFPAFTDRYMAKIHEDHDFMTYFSMQPLLDIHLINDFANEITPPGSRRMITFLSILAIFILAIAYLNYINLSTSKSRERANEVGIRKTLGARKQQLVTQFLTEAAILNFTCVILGFILAVILLPQFQLLVGKDIGNSLLNSGIIFTGEFWILFVACIITGSIFSGLYPAFVLSAFQPVQVIRGNLEGGRQQFSLRKILVGIQFSVSILLIAATLLISRQIMYMNKQDLGYSKDQIMVVKAPIARDSITYMKTLRLPAELKKLPFIHSFTKSSEVPGRLIPLRSNSRQWGQANDMNVLNYLYRVDNAFLDLYEIPMLAGRNFREIDSSGIYGAPNNRVVINDVLAKSLGYTTPEEALGQFIEFKLGQPYHKAEVIGVAENIHQRSLKEAYDPLLFYYPSWSNWRYYSVKLETPDLAGAISRMEDVYKSVFEEASFEYFFLDEHFDEQYRAERRFSRVCKVMAGLAIFITFLGLVGLSALIISHRTRELGIRKILGAGNYQILTLVSREFLILLAVSGLVTIPVIFYFGKKWLENFAFNNGLGWQIIIVPVFLLVIIILSTIGIQMHRSNAGDPVEALREQ